MRFFLIPPPYFAGIPKRNTLTMPDSIFKCSSSMSYFLSRSQANIITSKPSLSKAFTSFSTLESGLTGLDLVKTTVIFSPHINNLFSLPLYDEYINSISFKIFSKLYLLMFSKLFSLNLCLNSFDL